MRRLILLVASLGAVVFAVVAGEEKKAPEEKVKIPELKFNDVVEIAPGVFFRYSSIRTAAEPMAPFGGCNNMWVVFKDYVVVVDANFPKEAADVLAAIRKTTKLPIKYVLDTHHHGDHAYGNCVWAKEGAQIVASKSCARLLKTKGPKDWEIAGKDRKDIKDNELKQVDVVFEEKFVVDDGTQRVEFIPIGHCHTAGDAVAYLPKLKILCTGDACVNGAYNFLGHANSASWALNLEKLEKLEVNLICPGHGKIAGKELLAKQKRYFDDMRKAVKAGIDAKKSLEEITMGLDLPWYKEWTGKAARDIPDNVKHVFDEFMGKIDYDRIGFNRQSLPWPTVDEPATTTTVRDNSLLDFGTR